MSATTPAGSAPPQDPPGYPREWEADVVLADGGTVHLRPIRPDDSDALIALHGRLSSESIYFRFFSPRPALSPRELAYFTNVDYERRFALVAELGDHVIGVGRFDRRPGGDEAEAAFVVEDAHQGRGVGSVLLEHLAAAARTKGIHVFVAETLAENRRMLGVFHDAGFRVTTRFEEGVIQVRFSIDETRASAAVLEERERVAEARSIARLLAPRGVAVIGAGREPGGVGHEVLRALVAGGYRGALVPVHPATPEILGVRTAPSLAEAKGELDLGIVAVPAAGVADAVRACGERGLRGVVVVSRTAARAGSEREAEANALAALAHLHGMRLVGPRSLGLVNTSPEVRLFATPASLDLARGGVGFLSHSGELGIAVLEWAARHGLGLSSFAAVGDKADVSGNDLLQYWEEDDATRVVLLYLESFGNPRKFARIARRVARKKPIVALKAVRSRAALRASGSDVVAGDAEVDALFEQAGVLRVDTLEELFDAAWVLLAPALPRGRRVAVIGNAGGPAVVAADACIGAGLEVPRLGDTTVRRLRETCPEAAAFENPVDLDGPALPAGFESALSLVLQDPAVDAGFAIVARPRPAPLGDLAASLAAAASAHGKPVVACLLAEAAPPSPGAVPCFPFPGAAARALALAAAHAQWRARPVGRTPRLAHIDATAARKAVDAVLARSPFGATLADDEARDLLACYGLRVEGSTPGRRGRAGREFAAGVRQDPAFGPLVTLSAPGAAERFRILPLTDADARDLAAETLASTPALARTAPGPLANLLSRLGALADDVPELAWLSLEGVRPTSRTAPARAVRARLAPCTRRPEVRRLGRAERDENEAAHRTRGPSGAPDR